MKEIFKKVVGVVSEHTGASEEQIKTDKHEEYVGYRILLISALSKLGFSDREIAEQLKMTRQGVNWLKSKFTSRIRFNLILSSIWQKIDKELASNQFFSK